MNYKEKNVPLTIRLPESRVALIRQMAEFFHVSTSKLASTMLEAGFVIVDEFGKEKDGNGTIQ